MTESKKTTTPSKRLGRGLSSLLGEIEAPPEVNTAPNGDAIPSLIELDMSAIKPNPNQPRKVFDESALSELADSIKQHGVLQPIVVRPSTDHQGQYEIVAGERRWRAAKLVGLTIIPVIVKTIDELALLEVGIIENVQRENLNPIEEARAYQALIDRFGRTQAGIAQSVGKSRSHITNLLRLLNSSAKIQNHLLDGTLTPGHARALLMIENADALVDEVIEANWSVRDLESYTPSNSTRVTARKTQPTDVDTAALEADLSRKLGLNVQISQSRSGGSMKIKYSTLDQLDHICRKLNN